jgi:hypothetical protein
VKLDLYVRSAVFLFTQKAATHDITPWNSTKWKVQYSFLQYFPHNDFLYKKTQ